jgi:hypothetical protein
VSQFETPAQLSTHPSQTDRKKSVHGGPTARSPDWQADQVVRFVRHAHENGATLAIEVLVGRCYCRGQMGLL